MSSDLPRSPAAPAPTAARVRIVTADALAREAIERRLIEGGAVVIAESSAEPVDVVLHDGLPTAQALVGDAAHVALVPDAQAARAALGRGAHSVLDRSSSAPRLAAALLAARAGLVTLDPAFRPALVAAAGPETASALSVRERDVLELLVEGRSNREIGLALEISTNTVKFHVNAILEKLGASTRTEAVVQAARQGLIQL